MQRTTERGSADRCAVGPVPEGEHADKVRDPDDSSVIHTPARMYFPSQIPLTPRTLQELLGKRLQPPKTDTAK